MKDCRGRGGLREPTKDVFCSYRGKVKEARNI